MFRNKTNIISEDILKGATGIVACFFLLYTLYGFDGYDSLFLSFSNSEYSRWHLLFFVIILIPLNWYLESVKWKKLLKNVEQISLQASLYSVLTGLTTGIFSPARLGEFAGRVLLLRPENRKKASLLWAIGSMTMTIAIFLFGIPALYFYISSGKKISLLQSSLINHYPVIVLLAVFSLILLYFFVPYISKLFSGKSSERLSSIFKVLKNLSFRRLLAILNLSLLRYLVFCLQFWLMLGFFGVELSLTDACTGIFTSYLFITFLPSVFLTEAAVKSSVFLLIVSSFSDNSVAIISASMLIWILNVAIPTLLGVLLLTKKRIS